MEEEPTSAPRRLVRLQDDKMIAGVASGLGHYFGLDPVLIRLVLVALTVAGGVGIAVYLVGWLIMPASTTAEAGAPGSGSSIGGFDNMGTATKVVLAAASLIIALALFHHDGWFPGIALIVIGVLLLRRREHDSAQRSSGVVGQDETSTGITTPTYGSGSTVVSRPRRSSPLLFVTTLGSMLATTGSALLLDITDVVDLTRQQLLAVPLVTLGMGMLVGAMFGRGRALLLVGVPLTIALTLSSTSDDFFRGGDEYWQPNTASAVQSRYEIGVGQIVLDLSKIQQADNGVVDTGSDPIRTELSTGMGQVVVVVPRDFAVAVDASVGMGKIELLGQQSDGGDRHLTSEPLDGVAAELELEIHVGVGHVIVTDDPTISEVRDSSRDRH